MLTLTRYVALISALALGLLISDANSKEFADRKWWETTLVYQIWPRGFQDSNDDGEGDLKGIINRLDYLLDLGIETIWLNPIYPSPLIDSGYDVSNYTDIHPLFGNLSIFDNFIQEAHNRGLRVILDIIPNHSSDQHEWFKMSAQNIEPYTDYYIWTDGIDKNGTNNPRNNWVSTYDDNEGSAWTWHEKRQQWYYHKFHESQPDLNLRNEKVIKELLDIFDFWLKRDVDGFRINAVPYFFEDKALRNELKRGTYTFGLSESTALLYVFRKYIDDWVSTHNKTSKLLIAESYDISDNNLMAYYGNSTHKGIPPFNFKFITHVHNNSKANDIKRILDDWLKLLPENSSTNWVLSNHDNSRTASRIGFNRVDGLHMLSLLLPGQAYTYYGEEIAMLDTKISWDKTIDPMGCARGINKYKQFSRDPARTPMQWNSEISAGFSKNNITYLPIHHDYYIKNVETQKSKNESNLKTYKKLAILRKKPVFRNGNYELTSLNNDHVLVLKRFLENYPEELYIIVINLELRTQKINLTSIYPNLKKTLEIVVASSNAIHNTNIVPRDNFILTANAAFVLKGQEEKKETSTEPSSTPRNESTTSPITETTTNPTKKTTEAGKKSDDNAASNLTPAFQIMISAIIITIVRTL
ncbi:alpha-glucosidase [Anoplolepis gracilipes]|uniref:alpha-glucosidase n=1 Tax=Anoplolepis gracilipes TaxID=354296 RepID=UPI003BA23E03